MKGHAILVLLVMSVLFASLRIKQVTDTIEGFASLVEFSPKDLRSHFGPTGAPGEEKPHLVGGLPTFYPQVPGIRGTLKPDTGFRALKYRDGSKCVCPKPHPYDFRDPQRDTVCVKKTSQAFSNECTAKCMGFKPEELYPCKPRMVLYRMG
jgi:hypothetical protein